MFSGSVFVNIRNFGVDKCAFPMYNHLGVIPCQ